MKKLVSMIASLAIAAAMLPMPATAEGNTWAESDFNTDYNGWTVSTISDSPDLTVAIEDGSLALSGANSAQSGLKTANPAPSSDLLYMSFNMKNSTAGGLRLYSSSGDNFASNAPEWLGMIYQADGHMFLRNTDNSTTGSKVFLDSNFYSSPAYHQFDYVIDFTENKHYLYYDGNLKITASAKAKFNNIYLTTQGGSKIYFDNFIIGDYEDYIADYIDGISGELSADQTRVLTIASERLPKNSEVRADVYDILGISEDPTAEVRAYIDTIDYTLYDYTDIIATLNNYRTNVPEAEEIIDEALEAVYERVNYLQDIQDTTVVSQMQTGFTSTFDDINDFEADGWQVKGDVSKFGINNGALDIYGGTASAWHKGITASASDTVYIGFDLKINPANAGGLRLIGSSADSDEIFGMLNSGVFLRDKTNTQTNPAGTATYVMDGDNKFWPSNKYYNYEIIINNTTKHTYLLIDGKEYLDLGNQGAIIGDMYLKSASGLSSGSALVDNFTLKKYYDVVMDELNNVNIYATDVDDVLDAILAKTAYMTPMEGAYIEEEVVMVRARAHAASEMTNAFTPYQGNPNKTGAKELFILNDNITPVSIEVNGTALTENVDYRVNVSPKDGKTYYIFEAGVFALGENSIITKTAQKNYKDTVNISERAEYVYDILNGDTTAADHITINVKEPDIVGTWMIPYSYHGDQKYVHQVYNSAGTPSVTLQDSAISGTYEVFWYDISAKHSSLGELALSKVNFEVVSADGTSNITHQSLRNSTWQSIGTYTFSGSDNEYIKASASQAVSSGARFVGEGFKLVEPVADDLLEKVFSGAEDGWAISINENSSLYYDEPQLINIPESFGADDIAAVYINDAASAAFEAKDGMILLDAKNFPAAGAYNIYVKHNNNSVSTDIDITLNGSVIYYDNAQNCTMGTAGYMTSGMNHSRGSKVTSYKVPLKTNYETNFDDQTDEAYIEWTLPQDFTEGDYIADTWLANANLAIEAKAVITHAGGAVEEYKSLQLGGLYSYDGTTNYYAPVYFGNGAKIHLKAGDKIKITVDDDWENHAGQSLLLDSVRLTPYHDIEKVYKAFYGDNEIIIDPHAVTVGENGFYVNATTLYKTAKFGYNAYVGVYDGDRLVDILITPNVAFRDYDNTYDYDPNTIQLGFRSGEAINSSYTYKLFIWGGDADPSCDTSMKPYMNATEIEF